MADDDILIVKENRVCTVTLNRPRTMNAMTFDYVSMLDEIMRQIGRDEKINVVVLTGSESHFSSGGDMNKLNEDIESSQFLLEMKRVKDLICTMRDIPQPIICEVRGVAYGVSANIALSCDFVIASHDARFCEVFINIGAIMDGGGTYLLPRLVGLVKAREIAMLGNEIKGREAKSIGLIYQSVDDKELNAVVKDLAAELANKPRLAMTMIKAGLECSFEMPLSEALDWESVRQTIALQSPEHKKKVQQFLSKSS